MLKSCLRCSSARLERLVLPALAKSSRRFRCDEPDKAANRMREASVTPAAGLSRQPSWTCEAEAVETSAPGVVWSRTRSPTAFSGAGAACKRSQASSRSAITVRASSSSFCKLMPSSVSFGAQYPAQIVCSSNAVPHTFAYDGGFGSPFDSERFRGRTGGFGKGLIQNSGRDGFDGQLLGAEDARDGIEYLWVSKEIGMRVIYAVGWHSDNECTDGGHGVVATHTLMAVTNFAVDNSECACGMAVHTDETGSAAQQWSGTQIVLNHAASLQPIGARPREGSIGFAPVEQLRIRAVRSEKGGVREHLQCAEETRAHPPHLVDARASRDFGDFLHERNITRQHLHDSEAAAEWSAAKHRVLHEVPPIRHIPRIDCRNEASHAMAHEGEARFAPSPAAFAHESIQALGGLRKRFAPIIAKLVHHEALMPPDTGGLGIGSLHVTVRSEVVGVVAIRIETQRSKQIDERQSEQIQPRTSPEAATKMTAQDPWEQDDFRQ